MSPAIQWALVWLVLAILCTAAIITITGMLRARPMTLYLEKMERQQKSEAEAKRLRDEEIRKAYAARRQDPPKPPAPLPKDKLATQITRPAWYVASMKEFNEARGIS